MTTLFNIIQLKMELISAFIARVDYCIILNFGKVSLTAIKP